MRSPPRHREEQSDAAIQQLDCFASLAMTEKKGTALSYPFI
jgi:hypothetical protein